MFIEMFDIFNEGIQKMPDLWLSIVIIEADVLINIIQQGLMVCVKSESNFMIGLAESL